MRANNRFRGRRRAVSPASARRGAVAMGMMAQSGRRSAFRGQTGASGLQEPKAPRTYQCSTLATFFGGGDSIQNGVGPWNLRQKWRDCGCAQGAADVGTYTAPSTAPSNYENWVGLDASFNHLALEQCCKNTCVHGDMSALRNASGRRSAFRGASGGCEQDGMGGKACMGYNSRGVPCRGICSGGQCDCSQRPDDDWMRATGCYANQSGGFQGVEWLLDSLADPIDISGGDFGGVDSLLDDLATPQNDLEFGQGGGVPPTPVFPAPPRDPIVPVISGGGGGMPPYVPSTPTFPVTPASLMPPPASSGRRPRPRPRPMRPRNIGTGFSFM